MNRAVFLFLFLIFTIDHLQSRNSIIEDLQTNFDSSEGIIYIKADSAIMALINVPDNCPVLKKDQEFAEFSRFRIQVFMSNDPYKAHLEASSKQKSIKNAFPNLPTYLIFKSPNWKLLVGNFANREDATFFKERLRKKFPEFGKEMYVVIDR